ncbi:MAG: class IIb bacteriocin, lactobin A/cerein 7B family [Paracoccus sp. (in: a-proteobacteria)]
MKDDITIHEIDGSQLDLIMGGVAPIVVLALYAAAFGGGITFGYNVGKDRALRNNRR